MNRNRSYRSGHLLYWIQNRCKICGRFLKLHSIDYCLPCSKKAKKESLIKYIKSDKGKVTRTLYDKKYRKTTKRRNYVYNYIRSEITRAKQKEAKYKYTHSEKGKMKTKEYNHKYYRLHKKMENKKEKT